MNYEVENMDYVIKQINKYMYERGYSKSDLAANLGWAPSKITKMLSGDQAITVKDLISIGIELKINPALLLKEEPIPMSKKKTIKEVFSLALNEENNYYEFIEMVKNVLPDIMKDYLNLKEGTTEVKMKMRKRLANHNNFSGWIYNSAPRIVVNDKSAGSLFGKELSIGYWFKEDMSGVYLAINYNSDGLKASNDQDTVRTIVANAKVFRRWLNMRIELNEKPVINDNPDAQVSRYQDGMVIAKYYSFNSLPDEGHLMDDLITYYEYYKRILAMSADTFKRVYSIENAYAVERGTILDEISINKVDNQRRLRPARSAHAAFEQEGYKCELDKEHVSFTNRKNGKPYVMSSYLIPLSAENDFKYSLRTEANVCCLCPTCMAKLEYGLDSERQEMLMSLYIKHKDRLKAVGLEITIMELFKLYGI